MPDAARPVATSPDTQYSLTIDEVATLYARAGHPRTLRTVQRYCASGHLDCMKVATMLGDKYFVESSSVARHIAQIEEMVALDRRTQSPGLSRQDATPVIPQIAHAELRQETTTGPGRSRLVADGRPLASAETPEIPVSTIDEDRARQTPALDSSSSRQVAEEDTMPSRYVAQLEKRIEEKDQVISLITTQLTAKDQQISELSTRYRETHTLLGAMQRMLAPLLGQHDPYQAVPESRDTNPASGQTR